MRRSTLARSLLAAAVMLTAPALRAQEPEGAGIYGQELMSPAEQEAHRRRLQALKTEEERAEFLERHRIEMQARARAQDVELSDLPAPLTGRPAQAAARERVATEARDQERTHVQEPGADDAARERVASEVREREREEASPDVGAGQTERERTEAHEESRQRPAPRGDRGSPTGPGMPRGGARPGGGGRR